MIKKSTHGLQIILQGNLTHLFRWKLFLMAGRTLVGHRQVWFVRFGKVEPGICFMANIALMSTKGLVVCRGLNGLSRGFVTGTAAIDKSGMIEIQGQNFIRFWGFPFTTALKQGD